MIERKIIEMKKQELAIREYVEKQLGKSKISDLKIERIPVGEKIVVITNKPGLIIGREGENIQKISTMLRKKFNLENPQIEVNELEKPEFDAKTVADNIGTSLERFGPLRFKFIAYRALERIAKAGALGAEIRLSGKLPSERAKSRRFAFGFLKKTGETKNIVKRAKAKAFTKPGVIGIKVAIVPKDTKIPDKIEIKKVHIEIEEVEKEVKEKKEEEKEKTEKKKEKRKEKEKPKKTKKSKTKK